MIEFKINENHYIVYGDNIESIYLFGSCARGDDDDLSDVDLFVLIDDCSEHEFVEMKKSLELMLKIPAHWISLYQKSAIEKMCSYGSYFLWHLKNEGKLLYSRSGLFETIMNGLNEYTRVVDDLNDYLTICRDIRNAITTDKTTLYYELSVISSLFRNSCIALSYLNGKMLFGRVQPVLAAQELIGASLEFEINEYKELYRYRIAYSRKERKTELKEPSPELVNLWLKRVEKVIDFALKWKRGE